MNYADIIAAINETPNCYVMGAPAELAAKIESDGEHCGLVRIEVISNREIEGLVANVIEPAIVGLPLEWVASDEAVSTAWYRFTEDVGINK